MRWGKTRWRRLPEAGARFYEYQPARFHCKYLLVDDCWASVGSANLGNRSLSLNEEATLKIVDKKFVVADTRVLKRTRVTPAKSRCRIGESVLGAERSEAGSAHLRWAD